MATATAVKAAAARVPNADSSTTSGDCADPGIIASPRGMQSSRVNKNRGIRNLRLCNERHICMDAVD